MAKNDTKAPLLALNHIGKSYLLDGVTVNALDDITLSINHGEFVSILGPSGSGKSTLMHIMGFLDLATSGEIRLNGKKVESISEADLAVVRNQTIGFIFQQFNLLNRASAVENVALPLVYSNINEKERNKRATKLLVDLGLEDRLGNRPNQLSGGQQQRVAIARALINDPQIVFADEPTGNLDSKSGDEVMKILSDLNKQGRTIVLVTHEQEVADFANRKIYIKDGKIVSNLIKLKRKK